MYGMVKQSDGAISVESEPNRGCVFKVFLPACEGESSPDDAPVSSRSSASGNETILLVEDQAGIREVANEYLLQLGYNVLVAPDGEAAMEVVQSQNQRIDLLVTDLVMPNLTGMEVLERIMEFDPSTEVILMTAHYSTESAVEAIKKGASDYLNKPVSIAALRQKIGSVV